MKKIFLIILVIASNLLIAQVNTQIPKDEGVVKFTFLDDKKEEIIYFNCSITYGSTKINLYPNDARPESKRIHTKGGIYTFHFQSVDYKNVIISDVEVINERTTYLNIKLTPKTSKTDNDTIKIKWVMPKIDR